MERNDLSRSAAANMACSIANGESLSGEEYGATSENLSCCPVEI